MIANMNIRPAPTALIGALAALGACGGPRPGAPAHRPDVSAFARAEVTPTPTPTPTPLPPLPPLGFPSVCVDPVVCGRGNAGLNCATSSTAGSFGASAVWQPAGTAFSDGNGWKADPAYYGTIQFPDLDGDGRADACGRGGGGLWCALASGTSFGASTVWQAAFSDANGWKDPSYYATIHYPDLDGDGRGDVCGRGPNGLVCALSNGASFGDPAAAPALWLGAFSDANGWKGAAYYSTIRFPDLDGDGRADVCGRAANGLTCALSTGAGFGAATVWATFYSDGFSWQTNPYYYSTFQYGDLDGDGRTDVCARGSAGMRCALSTGSSFGVVGVWQPAASAFSDANGWTRPEYYSTIRLADINGDGKADVCGRNAAGLWCALSTGSGFGAASLWQSAYSDANGWAGSPAYYSTFFYADLDHDGKADVCARGALGLRCALSTGSAFGAVGVWQPAASAFSDQNGWNSDPAYYSTIQLAGTNVHFCP